MYMYIYIYRRCTTCHALTPWYKHTHTLTHSRTHTLTHQLFLSLFLSLSLSLFLSLSLTFFLSVSLCLSLSLSLSGPTSPGGASMGGWFDNKLKEQKEQEMREREEKERARERSRVVEDKLVRERVKARWRFSKVGFQLTLMRDLSIALTSKSFCQGGGGGEGKRESKGRESSGGCDSQAE